MSGIWDETAEVLRGRSAILTRIAIPALVVPAIVRDGWAAFAGPVPGSLPTTTGALGGALLGFLAALIAIWGQLAIIAVSSDPATTQADATRQASRRFLPALGVYAVAGIVAGLLVLPIAVALAGSGIDFAAMSRGQAPSISPGIAGFVGLYALAFVVVAILVGARLFVLNAVVVNERLGLGAYRRSWSLTSGLTWRVIGVTLLFVIVWLVVLGAAQLIVGLAFRLLLGAEALETVQFAVAVVAAIITAIYMVVVSVFAAQLYAALSGRRAAGILA
jgi:hypothetical protein